MRKILFRIAGLASTFSLSLGLAGCQESTGPGEPLESLPRQLSVAESEVITASNGFAFDLLAELTGQSAPENVVISPLSISMALGMTMNGARTETLDEMRGTLRFGDLQQAEINASYRSLIDLLLTLDPATEMRLANSVWYRHDFPFEDSFFDAVRASFDAEVRGLDFNDPGVVDEINGWVNRATNQRIPDIIEQVNPDDVMFLINAVYFKGGWQQRFDPSRTQDAPFTTLSGGRVNVPMMNASGTFSYGWSEDFQLVDLPYGNGAFTMSILLPREDAELDAMLDRLDDASWRALVDGIVERRIHLALPKLRLEYQSNLNKTLQALGMEAPFHRGADFTGMSSLRGRDLFISEVLHKTFLEVDEKGTEAAAATSVGIEVVSLPPQVVVDRPYVAVIRERFSGTILFMARIGDPRG